MLRIEVVRSEMALRFVTRSVFVYHYPFAGESLRYE